MHILYALCDFVWSFRIRNAYKNDNKMFASVANFKLVTPTAYLVEILLLLSKRS